MLNRKRTTDMNKSMLTSLNELIVTPRSTTGGQSIPGIRAYTQHNDLSQRRIQRRESFLAKLASINPGQVIDRLKDEKRLLERENGQVRNRIQQVQEQIERRKDKIAYFKEIGDQAISDRKQIYRDLAVFESNFARTNNYELRNTIDFMQETIQNYDKEMKEFRAKTDEHHKEGFPWLNPKQHDELDMLFGGLKEIKEDQEYRRKNPNFMLVENYKEREEGKQAF